MHAVAKYLDRHAEPEIRLAELVDGGYERSVVVPLFREDPSFVDGLLEAARTSSGRTLCIAVVNASEDASEMAHADNARLIDGLLGRLGHVRSLGGASQTWRGTVGESLDMLVVDRASAGRRLPGKHGVGLARKIGTDLALAMHTRGKIESELIFGTDADAVLPNEYFDVQSVEGVDVAALVFPFWHEATTDVDVTRATALYELSLRYYVAGLGWAGSPYAFHTLGSATAVCGTHYAAVRGYPKREAAEDFYLLNKLAKVGAVARCRGAPVRIQSRRSDRTPFGTGRRVSDAMTSGEQRFYAPEAFSALKMLIQALDAYSEHASVDRLYGTIDAFPEGPREATRSLFDELDAKPAFEATTREARTVRARLRRVHSWFDAFRTLKLVHALRDRCCPNVAWQAALEGAAFCPSVEPRGDLDAARRALARAEMDLPRYGGAALTAVNDRGRPGT